MNTGCRIIETTTGRAGRWLALLGLALAPLLAPGPAAAQEPPSEYLPHFEASLGAQATVREASRQVLTLIRDTAATEDYDQAVLKMEIGGGSLDYGDGTPLSTEAFGAVLGLGYKTVTGLGQTSGGAFVEGGTGSYETKAYAPLLGRDLRGDGDTKYLGGGLFFYNEFRQRTHLEVAVRAGSVSHDYGTRGYSGGNFDTSAAYYGAHLGIGRIFEVTDLTELDLYGQFHWTYTDGQDFRTEDATRVSFDSVNSYQSRLGARLTQVYLDGDLKGYVGAAWEHEFDGEAGGQAAEAALPGHRRPSLSGSSAFGEAGLIIQPVGGSYAVDLGVFGLGGQTRGLGGTAGLKFEF